MGEILIRFMIDFIEKGILASICYAFGFLGKSPPLPSLPSS